MARKLLHVEIDTSKVGADKLRDWVVQLLTLELPGNPIRSVEDVQIYVVLPSDTPSDDDEIPTPGNPKSEVA